MNRLPLLCLFLLLAPAVAGADDGATLRAKSAIKVFRTEYDTPDPGKRMEAVAGLREHRHPLVVEEIGRTGLVDRAPAVREVAARVLGFMSDQKADAGRLLTVELMRNEDQPEVQIAIIRAIRKLGYAEARDELTAAAGHFLEEEYRFVTNEVLITFGTLKDAHALPFLLMLAEYEGVYLRGRKGPRVRAANDADAKRIYEKKYGHLKNPKGTPETVMEYWRQELDNAIEAITGQSFETPEEFRSWLEKNYRQLGLKRSELKKKAPRKTKSPGLGGR